MSTELDMLEIKRKKIHKKLNLLLTIGIILLIILAFVAGNLPEKIKSYRFVAIVICGIVYYRFALHQPFSQANQLKKEIKKHVLDKIIQSIGDGIEYKTHGFVSKDMFIASDLFKKTPNRYEGENHFSIVQKDYRVEFSYVFAATQSSDGEYTSHLFSGLFFMFTIDKYSHERTLITPDNSVAELEFITDIFDKKKYVGYDRIKSENAVFEEFFNIFSNSANHAALMIDKNLQDILIEMRKKYDGQIQISFGAEKSYLMINTSRPFFKISIESDLNDEKVSQSFKDDLAECLEIIQSLTPYIQKIQNTFTS